MSIAFRNRTRGEIIAAFRESIRRKNECMKQLNDIMQEIRKEEKLSLSV